MSAYGRARATDELALATAAVESAELELAAARAVIHRMNAANRVVMFTHLASEISDAKVLMVNAILKKQKLDKDLASARVSYDLTFAL